MFKQRKIGSLTRTIGKLKMQIGQSMSDCGGYASRKTRSRQRKLERLRRTRRNVQRYG